MLVSYKWLKELVDIDVPSQELAEKMSTTGIEVEGVESPAAGLSKIVVGEVLSCEDGHNSLCGLYLVDRTFKDSIVQFASNRIIDGGIVLYC